MATNSLHASVRTLASAIRGLSIDGVQKANSGHPGLPLGLADLGALLFSNVLKHNPATPSWPDRDRFVLSAGHGSMFIYSLLHLSGYKLSLDDLKAFRQLGSLTPGHPEFGLTDGVETTTGPLGAGFANAVGMAMAETILAARFNTADHTIVDHYTYTIAGDGCLMEGVSAEAASFAGHQGFGKLIAFYDSNRITIEGETGLAFTEDVALRFEAYGWQILRASGYDLGAIEAQIAAAKAETGKPSLIVLDTIIGYGSPNKAGSHEVHGAPLGADEIKATKLALGLNPELDFDVAPAVQSFIAEQAKGWKKSYQAWQDLFAAWSKANPALKDSWDIAHGIKAAPAITWPTWAVGTKLATRSASGQSIQSAAAALPHLIGGSADLAPSNNTDIKNGGHFQKDSRSGRNLHFGVREHGMGNIVNGIVLHQGLKCYGATFMVFADYMRPAIRLAAIMKIPSIFVFTHDSFWVGEDGPTHQPVEHLASLRSMSNLEVLRPADAEETAYAWELALAKGIGTHHAAHANQRERALTSFDPTTGPVVLALTRQNLTVFVKPADWKESVKNFGAYLALATTNADTVILATGSELGAALTAAEKLNSEGKKVQVLSIPSMERFRAARRAKKLPGAFLPTSAKLYAVEAGHYFSWAGLVEEENFLGVSRFGESGPGEKVAAHFCIDAQGVADLVNGKL